MSARTRGPRHPTTDPRDRPAGPFATTTFGTVLGLAVVTGLVLGCADEPDPAVRAALAEFASGGPSPDSLRLPPEPPDRAALADFYAEREGTPAWIREGGLSRRARAFLELACSASLEGLDVARYDVAGIVDALETVRGPNGDRPSDPEKPTDPEESIDGEDPIDRAASRSRALAGLDLLLSASMARYAADVATGRIAARQRGAQIHLPARAVEPAAVLRSLTAAEDVGEVLASLRPSHAAYAGLRSALARYRQIAESGGWPPVPEGTYRPGDRGPGVAALRERLAATGDLGGPGLISRLLKRPTSRAFDQDVEAAVRRFQERHGLQATGVVEGKTLAALNVPVEDRITQIGLNLERWRFLPSRLGERHILVNLPAFHLEAREGERVALRMPVIVGEQFRGRSTPVFSDTLSHIDFAPYWWVPENIARAEIVPEAREDPGFLAANGYELVPPEGEGSEDGEDAKDDDGAEDSPGVEHPDVPEVGPDPASFDWSRVTEGGWRIRQRPGPDNALGRVKFVFPNAHAVYLHDTPEPELFERTERAFSHGCIRVAEPGELATWVLRDTGWTASRVEEAMSETTTRRVRVPEPIPVYILYLTAFVDPTGEVNFREDLYGYDRTLTDALRRVRVSAEAEETARRACRAF